MKNIVNILSLLFFLWIVLSVAENWQVALASLCVVLIFYAIYKWNKSTVKQTNVSQKSYSESDIQRMGLYVKRLIEIIRESLEIAEKSTNPETKISRLKLASDKLQDINNYIEKYPSVSLTNLDKLQNSIIELHDKFKQSGIYEIASGNVLIARDLLKQATQLKKEKRFDEACGKLKEAYSAYGANELMMKDFLRLPMYLQLAGRSEEGWQAINSLQKQSKNIFDQVEIAKQIQIFLRKEKKYKIAVLFAAWGVCKTIECNDFLVKDCIKTADWECTDKEFASVLKSIKLKVYGKTPSGNPITDHAYDLFLGRLLESKSLESIREKLKNDLEKTDCADKLDKLSEDIHLYIINNDQYQLNEVIMIFNRYLTDQENINLDVLAQI